MFATAVMGPSPSGGGAFDPESDISWHSLFWAEGTNFVAQGYTNGDEVTTWPNETAESDAVNYEATPDVKYVASEAQLNSQPAVEYGANQAAEMWTGTFSPALSYPVSFVIVAASSLSDKRGALIDGLDGSAQNRNQIRYESVGSGAWQVLTSTGSATGSQTNAEAFLAVGVFPGAAGNTKLYVNGTLDIDADIGADKIEGLAIGSQPPSGYVAWDDPIALVGIYEGDVTADGNWSAFESWVTSHYGITIS